MGERVRDPRDDPRKGDVTLSGDGSRYLVISRSATRVEFAETSTERPEIDIISLDEWQKFSRDDQVVYAGPGQ